MDYQKETSLAIDELTREDLESVLQGKTLRVYWWLLKNPGPHSGREVQRALQLSSPSLSIYHIEKLKRIGLVSTDADGVHMASREVRVGILEFFASAGHHYFPRNIFYSLFYTVILILLPLLLPFHPSPISIACYGVLAFGAITSWYESVRMWKHQPF